MPYLVTQTKVVSLDIGGVDYTDNLISWTASDGSANRQGCIVTTGDLILATVPGTSLEDYNRSDFVRGQAVALEVQFPSGTVSRHPRGLLYILASAYNPETEQIEISLGCRLALMALVDDYEILNSMTPLRLDPAQTNFQTCCAAFSTLGQYVYQNNSGALEVGYFFDGNENSWTSILGTTTTNVSPLAGGEEIPQQIKLTYQVPVDDDGNNDDKGKVEISETDSYYFLNYPVVMFARVPPDASDSKPNGNLDKVSNTSTSYKSSSNSDCGNTPDKPDEDENESCTEGYETKRIPTYVPARRIETSTSVYDGPGGQLSRTETLTYAPLFEANSQYFADEYSFCRNSWATRCLPNGNCPMKGLQLALLGKSTTENIYGAGNELVRQIQETWRTRLSAAKPIDWRSGIKDGVPQDFELSFELGTQDLYRERRVETYYERGENTNVQTTLTYTSMTSRGSGLSGGNIDAMAGIQTKQIRRSATISTLDVSPDIVNSPTTQTEDREDILLLGLDYYYKPSITGPYILEAQLPLPLFFDGDGQTPEQAQAAIEQAVATYGNALRNFVRGDAFGLQIGEAMREELVDWRPGMTFRYADNAKGTLVAMKMDATTWGANLEECAFVTEGLWVGYSNGTVTEPNNLYGNATPTLNPPKPPGTGGGGGGGNGEATFIIVSDTEPTIRPDGSPLQVNDIWQGPTELYYWNGTSWLTAAGEGVGEVPPAVDPGVDDETNVDTGSIYEIVNVDMMFQSLVVTATENGIQPPPAKGETLDVWRTMSAYVGGMIIAPGGLLATNGDGSIPVEYLGSLVTADATVVVADVFGS